MSEPSAPPARGKLNLLINVAILATLAFVLFEGSLGRAVKGAYDDWQMGRTITELWPGLTQGSSRLANSTIQPSRTVVEFVDYECPYCRRGASRVLDVVALEEADIVIRHLPLDRIHPGARSAAAAAICSERHGVFAEAHRRLLMDDDWLEDRDWVAWASTLGIRDTATFAACLQDVETARRIEDDMRLAARLGVTGTPAYVTVEGVFPADFEEALRSLPRPPVATAAERATGNSWRVSPRPHIEIGSVYDSDFVFHEVVGASFLDDGRIVVGNSGTSELLFFAADGEFQEAVGRRGDGPGEFLRIGAIGVGSNDTLFVFDRWNGRISVFDSYGTLARTAPVDAESEIPQTMGQTAGPSVFLSPVGWTTDGVFVASRTVSQRVALESTGMSLPEESPTTESIHQRRPEAELLFFDDRGTGLGAVSGLMGPERVSFVQRQSNSSSLTVGSTRVDVPFLRTLEAAVGWGVVAFGNTDSYEIRLAYPDGQNIATIRRSLGAVEVTDADRDRWIEGELGKIDDVGVRRSRRSLLETVVLPATLPAFGALAVQEGGRVWVEEFRMPADALGPSTWRVYDLDGRDLGEAVLPAGFRPHSITGDEIIGVWTDDLGIEYLRVYALDAPVGGR